MSDPIQALRFYADPETYLVHQSVGVDSIGAPSPLYFDGNGDRARAALAAYRWVEAPDAPGWWWCKRSGSEKQPVKVWREVDPFTGKEHLFALGTHVNALDAPRWCPVLPPPPREDDDD